MSEELLLKRQLAKAIRDKAKSDREIERLTSEIAVLSVAGQERPRQEFRDTGLAIHDRVRRTNAKSARERNLIGVVKQIKQEELHAPKALCEFSDRSRKFWYFRENLVIVHDNQR